MIDNGHRLPTSSQAKGGGETGQPRTDDEHVCF